MDHQVFFASVIAELVTKASLHPLDTIKARLQYLVIKPDNINNKAGGGGGGSSSSKRGRRLPIIGDILSLRALAQETSSMRDPLTRPWPGSQGLTKHLPILRSLYCGLSPALIGVLPVALVYMPTYEFTKACSKDTWLAQTPIAGVLTGLASALVRVPVSVIKIQSQLQLHASARAAVRHVLTRKEGWRGLYTGLGATICLDVSYAVIQFTLLEQMRAAAISYHAWIHPEAPRQDISGLSTSMNAIIGFWTGALSSAVTEPIDVIRTRLMANRSTRGTQFGYGGLIDGLKKAVKAEGPFSLWQGEPYVYIYEPTSSVAA